MARFAGPSSAWSARFDAQNVVDFPRARRLIFAIVFQHITAVGHQFVEEFARFVRLVQQMFRRHAQHLDDFVHLIDFVAARKQRFAGMHFDENTTQRPHVNGQVVWDAEQHFGWTVESRLNILIYLFDWTERQINKQMMKKTLRITISISI